MTKRPVAFHVGMWVSLILAMLTAWLVLGLLGWANPLLVLIAGLLLAGVFRWQLWPVFLILGGLPGYVMSPLRREFKGAWKKLDCKQKLVGPELTWLHENSPEGLRVGLPFYSWLKEEWYLEKATTGVSAYHWLERLVDATEEGEVFQYWKSRPDLGAARMYNDEHMRRRIGEFTDE